MYGVLDISASGLVAQRTRLNTITANIANREAILNADGEYEPYRRKQVFFATGNGKGDPLGVHVAAIEDDQSDLVPRYMPGSKYADEAGYVYYPNVNSVVEQMDAMEAYRAYEANIAAAEATKSMMTLTLQMIA